MQLPFLQDPSASEQNVLHLANIMQEHHRHQLSSIQTVPRKQHQAGGQISANANQQRAPIISSFRSHVLLPNLLSYANSMLINHHQQPISSNPQYSHAPAPISLSRLLRLPRVLDLANQQQNLRAPKQQAHTKTPPFSPPWPANNWNNQQLANQLSKAMRAVSEQMASSNLLPLVQYQTIESGSSMSQPSNGLHGLQELLDGSDIMETAASKVVNKLADPQSKPHSSDVNIKGGKNALVRQTLANRPSATDRNPELQHPTRIRDLQHSKTAHKTSIGQDDHRRAPVRVKAKPLETPYDQRASESRNIAQWNVDTPGVVVQSNKKFGRHTQNGWMLMDTNQLMGHFNHQHQTKDLSQRKGGPDRAKMASSEASSLDTQNRPVNGTTSTINDSTTKSPQLSSTSIGQRLFASFRGFG